MQFHKEYLSPFLLITQLSLGVKLQNNLTYSVSHSIITRHHLVIRKKSKEMEMVGYMVIYIYLWANKLFIFISHFF